MSRAVRKAREVRPGLLPRELFALRARPPVAGMCFRAAQAAEHAGFFIFARMLSRFAFLDVDREVDHGVLNNL